ncbi:MAG: hypothetical protein ICV66_05450 [Chitinophagaceae bacterium]|nr:hypothetical protein [Chitinophagaceae bacterium]
MAMTSTTVQPVTKAPVSHAVGSDAAASILAALMLAMYAGAKSRKQLRKLKYKLAWLLCVERFSLLKSKVASLFSKRPGDGQISTKTLLIILIAVLALILLFLLPWYVSISVLLIGILLVLLLKF